MAFNYNVNTTQETILPIAVTALTDGWLLLGDNTMRHNSTKTTRISKEYVNIFNVGTSYKVQFTIDNYISCDIKIIINGVSSSAYNGDGLKEYSFIASDTTQTITFESNGYLDLVNVTVLENVIDIEPLDYNDVELFENKSFTASFDPLDQQWISYHTYIPDMYLPHNIDFLTFDNNQLNKSNGASYNTKFILEAVFNEAPLYTKVTNSINVNIESSFNGTSYNDFFDTLLVYNERQISDTIALNNTNLTKKEKDWNVSKFFDRSIGANNIKLFSKDWIDVQGNYYIDKVINPSVIDTAKPWYKLARFRDKYLIARFTYDNLEMKKIIVNFVNSIYRVSQR